jgi:hypothetical protein
LFAGLALAGAIVPGPVLAGWRVGQARGRARSARDVATATGAGHEAAVSAADADIAAFRCVQPSCPLCGGPAGS